MPLLILFASSISARVGEEGLGTVYTILPTVPTTVSMEMSSEVSNISARAWAMFHVETV